MENLVSNALGALIVYFIATLAVCLMAISAKIQGDYNETFPKGLRSIMLYGFLLSVAGGSLYFFPLLWGGLAVGLFYLFIARPGLTGYGYQMCWDNESALRKDEEIKDYFFKHHAVVMGVMLLSVAVMGQLSVVKTGTYENPVCYIMATLALYPILAAFISYRTSERSKFPWDLCVLNALILMGVLLACIYLI